MVSYNVMMTCDDEKHQICIMSHFIRCCITAVILMNE